MVRTFVTFADIDGKRELLHVECTKCPRKGRYSVARLIAKHGRRGNLTKWLSDLNSDCPKREAFQLQERCDVRCPDLVGLESVPRKAGRGEG